MQELRGYVAARGWATSVEFTDIGVSGAKSRRPALDRLVLAAGRRRERVVAGLARAKRDGTRLGRRRTTPLPAGAPPGLTVRQAAALWSCSRSTAARRLAREPRPTGGGTNPHAGRSGSGLTSLRFSPDQAVRRTGVCLPAAIMTAGQVSVAGSSGVSPALPGAGSVRRWCAAGRRSCAAAAAPRSAAWSATGGTRRSPPARRRDDKIAGDLRHFFRDQPVLTGWRRRCSHPCSGRSPAAAASAGAGVAHVGDVA